MMLSFYSIINCNMMLAGWWLAEWQEVDLHGSQWVYMVFHRFTWFSIDFDCFPWIYIVFH